MVKKLFFLLLLGCPLILFADDPASRNIPKQISATFPKACCKEYFTHEERGLVHKLWSLVKRKKFNTLQKLMTQDFRVIFINGAIQSRTYALYSLINSQIIDYSIQDLLLTRTEDCIIATYVLNVRNAPSPMVSLSTAEMSTFQKVHGTWKWKADANMNQYYQGGT